MIDIQKIIINNEEYKNIEQSMTKCLRETEYIVSQADEKNTFYCVPFEQWHYYYSLLFISNSGNVFIYSEDSLDKSDFKNETFTKVLTSLLREHEDIFEKYSNSIFSIGQFDEEKWYVDVLPNAVDTNPILRERTTLCDYENKLDNDNENVIEYTFVAKYIDID